MKDKPPTPIASLTDKGLSAATPYDLELLLAYPMGHEFDLSPRSGRSPKHHRTYWKALNTVVKSTGRWPSSKHLHRELKLACGYVEKMIDWRTGETITIPDSIAFGKMDQAEFKVYFDIAMNKLGEAVGFDPLIFMEGA